MLFLIFIEAVNIASTFTQLPSDPSVVPQSYTVNCIVVGYSSITVGIYYDGIFLSESYCSNHDGYNCFSNAKSTKTNYTYNGLYTNTFEVSVAVEWEAKIINSGAFRQSLYKGDHVHTCIAAVSGRTTTRTITISGT